MEASQRKTWQNAYPFLLLSALNAVVQLVYSRDETLTVSLGDVQAFLSTPLAMTRCRNQILLCSLI
jgi:hypothetical protein